MAVLSALIACALVSQGAGRLGSPLVNTAATAHGAGAQGARRVTAAQPAAAAQAGGAAPQAAQPAATTRGGHTSSSTSGAAAYDGAPGVLDACPATGPGHAHGSLQNAEINEASGVAASQSHDGVYWMNNDSGDWARLFGIDKFGSHIATLSILGASAIDWEDLAVGPGPIANRSFIYVGDLGDNSKSRDYVQIYRMLEPSELPRADGAPASVEVTADRFDIRYPDARHDCEAMFVDPSTGDVYIVTKSTRQTRIYRVSLPVQPGAHLEFEFIGAFPALMLVTSADITPEGSLIAVRNYEEVRLWTRGPEATVAESLVGHGCPAASEHENQGEAVAFGAVGDHYVTVSEGAGSLVWYFPVQPAPTMSSASGSAVRPNSSAPVAVFP